MVIKICFEVDRNLMCLECKTVHIVKQVNLPGSLFGPLDRVTL